MIFPFLKFIFGRRRNLPRQFFFFNDDFFALFNDALRSCLYYLPFNSLFFPTANRIPNTVNARLEDTLL